MNDYMQVIRTVLEEYLMWPDVVMQDRSSIVKIYDAGPGGPALRDAVS